MRRTLIPLATALATVVAVGGSADAHGGHGGGNGGGHGNSRTIELSALGTHYSDIFEEGAAEIVAHDPRAQRLYVVNAAAAKVQVLNIAKPSAPVLVNTLDPAAALGDPGAVANSVAVRRDGVVAVAVEAGVKTAPGHIVFYDRKGRLLKTLAVGALPDMAAFSDDGDTLLVANEGEPDDDFTVDPEGSVSIVDTGKSIEKLDARHVRTADFRAWDRGQKRLDPTVRVYGPDVSARPDGALTEPGRVARNLEPEYITLGGDGRTAYVTLQEANAIAVLDIRSGRFTDIRPLGFKDHMQPGNEIDVSDQDGKVQLANWPVYGMYEPDAITTYQAKGRTFLVTANEGDAREWGDYTEPERFRSLTGDTPLCADSPRVQAFLANNPLGITTVEQLRANTAMGRLNVTQATGLSPDGTCYQDVYSLGGRSFTIWTTDGRKVFDSGSQFEKITAQAYPQNFNASNTSSAFDNRSDDKGPEPEAVEIGRIGDRTYAFIALERIGGVMVYDITNPYAPEHVQYINNRDFAADPKTRAAGDLGPESVHFVEGKDSPTGKPVLAVGNEISGTTTLFAINTKRKN
ncbi:choice-of-anchor I family protein [Streptomycetaceae bacterium NBC_01309]